MTYADYMRQLRARQRADFALLTEEEQREQWQRRQRYLWSHFLVLPPHYINITVGCPVCQPGIRFATRSWPAYFSCACGTYIALCRWLPDDRERVATMSTQALLQFAKQSVADFYGYPLEERLADLSQRNFFKVKQDKPN